VMRLAMPLFCSVHVAGVETCVYMANADDSIRPVHYVTGYRTRHEEARVLGPYAHN
jgi:hypothetical protein